MHHPASHRSSRPFPLHLLTGILLGWALSTGCAGHRNLADPTVVLQTQGGRELGVSTDYGVVFLGQTARSGYVEVESWFGDGPSIEPSVIEPVGGGIFTAETEIRLPHVTMTFQEPEAGSVVRVLGRTTEGGWTAESTVRSDPRVYGILIDVPFQLRSDPDQVGAGVYWVDPNDSYNQRLIGLVSGHVTLSSDEGEQRFLTVVGPQDLWRLVTHRRDLEKRRPWVYRDDIL